MIYFGYLIIVACMEHAGQSYNMEYNRSFAKLALGLS